MIKKVRLISCLAWILSLMAMGCRPHFSPDKNPVDASSTYDSLLEVHIDILNTHLPYELSKGLVFHHIMLTDEYVEFGYWCNWKDLDSPEFINANRETFTEMFRNLFTGMAQDTEKYGTLTAVLAFAARSNKDFRTSLKTRKNGFTHHFKVFTNEELNDMTSDYLLIKNKVSE